MFLFKGVVSHEVSIMDNNCVCGITQKVECSATCELPYILYNLFKVNLTAFISEKCFVRTNHMFVLRIEVKSLRNSSARKCS